MPKYKNALADRPANMLAYQDTLSATPRNEYLGALADFLAQSYAPQRTQQMQGVAEFLQVPAISQTLDRLSYGEPLTTGAGMTTRIRPEALEAAIAVAPTAKPVTMATLAASRAATRAALAGKVLPVGMSIEAVGGMGFLKNIANKDVNVGLNESSNFLSAKSPFGEVGGTIRQPDRFSDKPYLQINYAEVEQASRGSGKGKELYKALIDEAQKRGLRVFSDSTVEKAAVNVYKSLERNGYKLQDMSKGSLDDGAVYGAGAQSPAFEISPLKKFQYPQEEAMRLAQQRAALPVEQGGLGLPADNTAQQRAKAMGGKNMVHFSRTGGDYPVLDSGQYATAPFDAVGTHVGTPQAALDRFRNTTATTDQIKGTTYPVTILGDRPLMNQNGMPWGEDDLNAFLRQTGEYNSPNVRMTYPQMNAQLREKLFNEQGYTSIPYFNEVEGKGSTSFIVPPENIRSRFAAFDPFRRTATIAATMGVAAPDLLAAEQAQQDAYTQNEMRKFMRQGRKNK